jgi:membrane fusion protein (multidrug efflux system)
MVHPRLSSFLRRGLASLLLLAAVAGTAYGFHAWKRDHQAKAAEAAKSQPEPAWAVEAAEVRTRPFARSSTTIGTVRALQSITLRNELPGTVRQATLQSGQVVDAGALLVELDVTVEQAELAALQAEAALASTMLARMEQAEKEQGASAADVDRARAQHDMALANVERTKALIERKRVRAPFRARVGMVDLHLGQYLEPGTEITTLQGLDEAVHVDFALPQDTAAALQVGGTVDIGIGAAPTTLPATIVAIDARVEVATRNTWLRALLRSPAPLPAPGASVRVKAPVEAVHDVMVVPVNALRRGPGGEHVFAIVATPNGQLRAEQRRVTAGTVIGDDIVVTSGVQVGERVATTGSFKLQPGWLLAVTNAATAPRADGAQQK